MKIVPSLWVLTAPTPKYTDRSFTLAETKISNYKKGELKGKNFKQEVSEKGITLVELLIVLAILVFVTGALSMATITIMKVSSKSNDWAIALRQAQNAGYWISRDALMSENVTISGNPLTPEFVTLTLPITATEKKSVVYKLEDMAGGTKKLTRTIQDTGVQILIAENIDGNNTSVNYQSPTLTFTITATSGEATVSRKYKATRRIPDS